MKTFFVTTPIYYVNAPPHIGHAYTTLAADILARYKRMRGLEVRFLTGTDEHGSKIETIAREAGSEPKAFADAMAGKFRELWKQLDIQHDDFIRTTEPRHEARVQAVFERLKAAGDIYKGMYRGYYCVSCETYWTETEAPEEAGRRLCPNADCRKPLQLTEEESYFFRLSRYQDRLLALYRERPGFLQPASRAPEILRFVEAGLRDLAVSRTKVRWGIPVPSDPGHVVYVWFDALLNYVTAAGYRPPGYSGPDGPEFSGLWPADVHLVGKEIYRFHAVIWPAMLMALGLEPPGSVFAHGWWTVEGEKMSKSRGNFVDPWEAAREFGTAGVDAFRYFLFREMPFGNDGDYSRESLRKRYNAELANDLGNLLNRVVDMVDRFLAGELPGKGDIERAEAARRFLAQAPAIDSAMERLAFCEALTRVFAVVGELNRLVNEKAPWKLAKTDKGATRAVLFDLVCSLRMVAGWLYPFMPQTAARIQAQLGVRRFPDGHGEECGGRIQKGAPLFPRK